jgi:thioredoxin 1
LGGVVWSLQDDSTCPRGSGVGILGKATVAKLNIDDNPNTPPKYGIRGIPTLMLFKGGNVEATKVGAVSKSQLTAFIDGNL